ncbi:MAG TPA: hypothetical protein VLT33_04785 [Labilithrix sp.]|nr:hypothetical protein [Labilithrix sp.]
MVALALLVTTAAAFAWPACDGAGGTPAKAEVDLGPTYGLEVTVAVRGRGRVVSEPAALDCPTRCFGRIVLRDPSFDGSAAGLTLGAEENVGSHFVGWTYEAVTLGVRARGPSQCSPMTRHTSVLPTPSATHFLSLAFGETEGTPPAGLEGECAPFTTVPVAYAITATFEENDVTPTRPPPPDPLVEIVFEPPMLGTTIGREIGVVGGKVYWRFDRSSSDFAASGIASGKADGSGGGSTVIVAPNDGLVRVSIGRTLVFQHTNGLVETIQTASGLRSQLPFLSSSPCFALASDDTTAYCRLNFGGGTVTYLYSWPIGGSTYNYVYTLPGGYALALDDQSFYFSEEQGGGLQGAGFMDSAPRVPDGGFGQPVITKLVPDQSSPRDLVMSSAYMFWLDHETSGTNLPTAAPKTGADAGVRGGFDGKLLAVDPVSPSTYYVAIGSNGPGGWSILKASATQASDLTGFRSDRNKIGGLAVDATHVYWTQDDGRVYRAPKD